ncbi:hypothetical protein MNBD_GAMMA12-1696 [hydrothermal vent metagenome]|uniref:HMA domain-containing protein n=1 Tax=hydrothermal vent metagenome TaxID=652676 RepID=A0A3B0YAF6_9ZZZZ
MKKLVLLLLMSFSFGVFAEGSRYLMRVDGLACPYCAYGIEKKLKKVSGLSNIKVDLKKGVVTVDASKGTVLEEAKMKKLFKDAGFTYRSMQQTKL